MNAKTAFGVCTNSFFAAPDVANLEISHPGPAPRAGQFFLIKPRRTGIFLGRPISAAGWSLGKDGVILRFLIALRGRGSRELAGLRPGEEAELIGPLGNSWAEMYDSGAVQAKPDAPADNGPVALVAGGIGIAPLLFFARELGERNKVSQNKVPFDFYAGFRTGSFGLEDIKPRSLIIATEDGSEGLKGRIPDFFTPSGYSGVFVCGPEPMLRAAADACIAAEVPCFISVEKHMACGVGACLGCTVKTIRGNRRCCADGPIFSAEDLCFDSK